MTDVKEKKEEKKEQINRLIDEQFMEVEVEGESKNKEGKKRYDDKEVKDFDDMGLKYEILRGIFAYGWENPSKIQAKAILPLISSKPPVDMIGQAQSGTGKTATFAISMLQNLDDKVNKLQGIAMAPTRELAIQIFKVFNALSIHLNFKIHCCVGGTKVQDDIDILNDGVHIVVGTPGRIKHMVERNYLPVKDIKMLVIDEADEMLSKGFKEQLYELFTYFPENMQIGLFSATMPPEVVQLSEQFMRDPIKILVKKDKLTLEGIKQFFVNVKNEQFKFPTLIDLYKTLKITKAIIFCNSRKRVDMLADRMNEQNFTVSKLHSGLREDRMKIMNEFRTGSSRILISTDLLARGIDVHQVSLVINYDLCRKKELYLHRIGRSGRYGRKGVSINLLTEYDINQHREIEQFFKTTIEPLPKNINKYL